MVSMHVISSFSSRHMFDEHNVSQSYQFISSNLLVKFIFMSIGTICTPFVLCSVLGIPMLFFAFQ